MNKEQLINEIIQCNSLNKNCDFLLEHSDCDFLTEIFEENKQLKEKNKQVLKMLDDIQQNIFGFEETNWIYYDISDIVKILKGGE